MTAFWGLAVAMVIIALLFTVPWIMRGERRRGTDADALNVAVIKTQLEELNNDLRSGRLDETDYADARADLERELLDDLAHDTTGQGPAAVRSGRWGALLLVVLVPLVSFALYQKIGTRQIIPMLAEETPDVPSPPLTQQSIQEMVEKLEQRMREQPDDVEGWTMLARSYRVLERYPEAAAAYQEALQRDSENVALMVNYADVLAMVHDGRFTAEASALLDKALELQPDNIVALWLSGHRSYRQGRYEESLGYWRRAAGLLPANSPDGVIINQQIAMALQQLGIEDNKEEQAAPAPSEPATGPALHVRVSLDAALQDRAEPDDTVFVFARAMDGPRIPLAIVRKQVSDLPVTVVLDDSQAMSPAMVLSAFENVEVGARISRSGNAMPQSGDLRGTVAPVATRDSGTVSLVISETVP
jgi:cytochrome c-type biogenesis protein CcmH